MLLSVLPQFAYSDRLNPKSAKIIYLDAVRYTYPDRIEKESCNRGWENVGTWKKRNIGI